MCAIFTDNVKTITIGEIKAYNKVNPVSEKRHVKVNLVTARLAPSYVFLRTPRFMPRQSNHERGGEGKTTPLPLSFCNFYLL